MHCDGVRTFIEYVDAPADGLGASDTNHITTDYKTAKVTVSYTLNGLAKSLALVSNFVPAGIESSTAVERSLSMSSMLQEQI